MFVLVRFGYISIAVGARHGMLIRDQHDANVACLYGAAMGKTCLLEALQHIADSFGVGAAVLAITAADGAVVSSAAHGRSEELAENHYASKQLPDEASLYLMTLSTVVEGLASAHAAEAFHRLAPFIKQACAIALIIENAAVTQAALVEALAARADGVILLAQSGAITFLNDAAAGMLALADGLALEDGVLVARRGPEKRRLHALIRDVIAASGGAHHADSGGEIIVSRISHLKPYVVRVLPSPQGDRYVVAKSVACVLQITDLARAGTSVAALRSMFGLTRREADLATALMHTVGLVHAAADAGMAHNTARNHLQAIFCKIGVKTQAEALQLFSRL